jgi:hypothetical protein
MNRHICALLLLLSSLSSAAEVPWKWQESRVIDPGFDLDTAQIVRVTNLKTKGKGSLRDSLKIKGPRIIVFEVSGVIDLDRQGIKVMEPQVYIAGQTAPSPGITLIRGGLALEANQCVAQHLHVRPGDAGQPKKSGWEPDAITTSGGPVDVWIDHCSATWALDENISATTYKSPTGEPARRIHIQHCIIAEGLSNASHSKGPHSKGTLVFGGTQQVAIVGNLYASNTERNPVFQAGTSGVIVNNVIANPGERAIHAHGISDAKDNTAANARIAVVGNVVLFGEKTKKTAALFEGSAAGFFKDNEGFAWDGKSLPVLRVEMETLTEAPVWPQGLQPISTTAAMWNVARFAGARPAERDATDTRIVREALTGAAHIIDSQDEVGGYPKIESVERKLDVPETGRREWLEKMTREVELGVDQ